MPWSIIFEWWIGSILNLKRKMAKIIGFWQPNYFSILANMIMNVWANVHVLFFFIRLWSIHNCYLSFLQWGFYFFKVFFFIIIFFVLFFYCIFSILNVVFRRSYFPWYFCTGIVSWIFLRKTGYNGLKYLTF